MFLPSLLPQSAIHREVRTLQGHTNSVASVAFSPDGHTLASEESDRRSREGAAALAAPIIKLWDVASGQVLRTLQGQVAENVGARLDVGLIEERVWCRAAAPLEDLGNR